jgi:hypothetical protein
VNALAHNALPPIEETERPALASERRAALHGGKLLKTPGTCRSVRQGCTRNHNVHLDAAEVDIGWQLQRVRRQLLHRETKTDASEATLPLPDLCVAVLRERLEDQVIDRLTATPNEEWDETGLVFTSPNGSPVDPRNFNRSFHAMCDRAGVRRITVTMNIYTDVPPAVTRDALKRLGTQLGGA